jgi:CheY-like chemotaxis protein
MLGGRQPTLSGCEPELSGQRTRISPLIAHIDDTPPMLELTRLVLERARFRYEGFTWTADIIDYCNQTLPDVIITDLMRPDMSGWDYYDIVRGTPALRNVPILVLSAGLYAYSARISALIGTPGLYLMSKPFEPHELVSMVGQMVTATR